MKAMINLSTARQNAPQMEKVAARNLGFDDKSIVYITLSDSDCSRVEIHYLADYENSLCGSGSMHDLSMRIRLIQNLHPSKCLSCRKTNKITGHH